MAAFHLLDFTDESFSCSIHHPLDLVERHFVRIGCRGH
jgi:hypothetical protein